MSQDEFNTIGKRTTRGMMPHISPGLKGAGNPQLFKDRIHKMIIRVYISFIYNFDDIEKTHFETLGTDYTSSEDVTMPNHCKKVLITFAHETNFCE